MAVQAAQALGLEVQLPRDLTSAKAPKGGSSSKVHRFRVSGIIYLIYCPQEHLNTTHPCFPQIFQFHDLSEARQEHPEANLELLR